MQEAGRQQDKQVRIEVIAMNDHEQTYQYPPIVVHTIRQQAKEDYYAAAEYINQSGADMCIVQHEYGIFGGESGVYLLQLLKNLKVPMLATLHTVLKRPNFHQREVLKKISAYAAKLVVMSPLAIEMLKEIYDINEDKIVCIEHGVPDYDTLQKLPAIPEAWQNRKILLTFGLLGRNKGIETVIRALPKVTQEFPDLLYIILGKTHPHVARYAGEEYRFWLEKLAYQLGVKKHVVFVNEYVDEPTLMAYLKAADIYITPYLNKAQITSGTLSYALGSGCGVLSTPYWHAEQLALAGLVRTFGFGNSEQLANLLLQWLRSPESLQQAKEKALAYGKENTWTEVGKKYIHLVEQESQASPPASIAACLISSMQYPFSLAHIKRLTDCTGIIQHATGAVPSYSSGYCLDDNARALLLATMGFRQSGGKEVFKELASRYLAYLQFMHQPDGRMLNLCSYQRVPLEDDISEDSFGRAIWALGYTIRYAPSDSLRHLAYNLWHSTIQYLSSLKHIRGYANAIFGLYHYYRSYPDQEIWQLKAMELANEICKAYETHHRPNWDWFEEVLTYDNGLVPAALYRAFSLTLYKPFLEIANLTTEFLEEKCLSNGFLMPIGNRQWYRLNEEYSPFGQQPIDATAMVILYDAQYKATRNKTSLEKMELCLQWFLGNNELGLPLYDFESGGCHDGLEMTGINHNQGAESTISYLLAWLFYNEQKPRSTFPAI
jgi:glycosyltransferase involved in cell wall biosynthesis